MLTSLRRLWLWLRSHEPMVLVALLAASVAVWGFIEIASEVVEGDTQAFDRWVVRAMRQADDPAQPRGPGWLQEMGRDATAFGGIGALVLFIAAVSGYLWIDGKSRMMWFLIASSGSGILVSSGLKHAFSRPRPDIVPHLSIVYTSSFPSGHSMLAAVVYLTLGSLLAAAAERFAMKLYVLTVAILLTMLVGMSRVYLGVHYPTDVLAGWIAGLTWALLCWLVARWLQRHRQIEKPQDSDLESSSGSLTSDI